MNADDSLAGLARDVRRWYVTARNQVRGSVRGETRKLPFGTAHLKEVGSSRTACGTPALEWKLCWDLRVSDVRRQLCRECSSRASQDPDEEITP